jgi:hypothetical protein
MKARMGTQKENAAEAARLNKLLNKKVKVPKIKPENPKDPRKEPVYYMLDLSMIKTIEDKVNAMFEAHLITWGGMRLENESQIKLADTSKYWKRLKTPFEFMKKKKA